jgi:predicted membrane-bound spermidine synthase
MRPVLYLVCTLSGASALLFETLWFRLAALVFGNTVWASSVVLASFMGGLALGSYAAASRGRRLRRPLRAYAALEIAVATSGVVLVLLLPRLSEVLAPLFGSLVDRPASLQVLRLAVAFGLMLVPAAAMGATLPVLVVALARRGAPFGPVLGAVYGWNTFGAVAGCLAGELWLVGRFGLLGTGALAGLLDLIAAALAGWLSLRAGPASGPEEPAAAAAPLAGSRAILAAAAICGGLLLALEVVWFRLIAQVGVSTQLVFATLLAIVLAGIACGGWLAAAWLRRDPDAARSAAALALGAGAATLCARIAVDRGLASTELITSAAGMAARAFPLMFPTSLLSGALFTLLGSALRRRIPDDAEAAGLLTLLNTLGALFGSLAGGFVLLPLLGVEGSLRWLGAGYALVALAALGSRPRRAPVALAAAAFVLAFALFPAASQGQGYRAWVERRWSRDGSVPVAWREGLTASLLYTKRSLFGEPLSYRLVTNGYSMAATQNAGRRYMKAFVYWPVAFHPAPRRALVICYGMGSTAAALVDTAELQSIDVVDLSREVLEMGRLVVRPGLGYPLDDRRVRTHVEDGRFYLLTRAAKYDLITGEPPPPRVAGVVDLYTREYFALLKAHLAEGGIASYWLPVSELRASETRAIVAAFCSAFEDCSLWSASGLDWMLVGSRGAAYSPGPERLWRQWRDPGVSAELSAVGFDSPAELLGTFLADASQLADWTRGVAALDDDHPQRLLSRVIPWAEAAKEHADMMDARASLRRFDASRWPERLGSDALRESTRAFFEFQDLANRADLRSYGLALPGRTRDRAVALRRAPSPWVPLRLLGTDPDQQALAARAGERGVTDSSQRFLTALGAAAARDFATAERLVGEVLHRNPRQSFLVALQAQFLCLQGRPDAAREVVERARARAPGLSLDADFQDWARDECGMARIDPAPRDG